MKTITIKTCASIATDITGNPAEQEWLVKALSGARRNSRVKTVCQLAMAWGNAIPRRGTWDAVTEQTASALVACTLDINGVGGPNGIGGSGCASRRHPAFQELPRKRQATGAVWTAAIEDATRRISRDLVRRFDDGVSTNLYIEEDGTAAINILDRDNGVIATIRVPFVWQDAKWRLSKRRAELLATAENLLTAETSQAEYVSYDSINQEL